LDLYRADLSDESRDPYYLLVEFPYPSGDLHIGHWYAFAVTDIYARMLRARGKNVLFPIGFDAFGLPAENAAIKHGLDPKEWTYKNIDRMRTQIATMGASFDWSKEVVACDPDYYRWTQWLFTKLFEHDLAERREAPVKWCPRDQTVLANEQVVDGRCERCGTAVEEKRLTQWFLKITNYAERLLEGLDTLPWREEIKEAQRAWIGKSDGAYLEFPLKKHKEKIKVFTTRPDTLFGATYVVLAPDHRLVSLLLSAVSNKKEIEKYIDATTKKTERERSENKEKTGVKLEGIMALNPATGEEIPVYVADYVLASYGTGAVMAVPAHDERDFDFAKKHGLPIRYVIDPVTGEPQENPKHKEKIVAVVERDGELLTIRWPDELGGRLLIGGTAETGEAPALTAAREITEETGYTDLEFVEEAEETGHHSYFAFSKKQATVAHSKLLHFRLKSEAHVAQKLEADEKDKFKVEWVSKEQAVREIHDELHQRAIERFFGKGCYTGDGILARSGEFSGKNSAEAKWDIVKAVDGERATQYRLRDWLVSRQRYWGCPIPIVYDPSGKPHAIPAEHLPWFLPTDVNFKPTGEAPLASSKELRERVTNIFGEGWTPEYDTLDTFVDSSWYFLRYLDPKDPHDFSDIAMMKRWLPVDRYSGGSEHTTMHLLYARFFTKALYDLALVPVEEPFQERFNRGLIMGPDGQKMSKSKGNVINPDDFVEKYGADAVRTYLAFIGPYNEPGSYPWNLDGVAAMRKFLERVARFIIGNGNEGVEIFNRITLEKHLAKTGNNIIRDGDRFKFNTCLAFLMTFLSAFEKAKNVPSDIKGKFVVMLAPFAPHLAEHLWEELGGKGSVHEQPWPAVATAAAETSEVVVQVNGKRRGSVTLAADVSETEAVAAAHTLPAVATALSGKEPKRVVYVPGKIVNLVL
ncbi:MAG: class I tRNA ligase family protein, partial [Patescibacteria group bacterium]|nr:class I tRNA ligase family protein [Patescibacteria group bacterium]